MSRFNLRFSVFLLLLYLTAWQSVGTLFAHTQTQIIKMTPSGFEPQEVTIDTNSSVIFVNQDTKARWPASNPHPTHDLYPEFDPQKPIKSGESWPFKPIKAGTWKYHDHFLPHIRGTLIVKGEGSPSTNKNLNNSSSFLSAIKNFLANFSSQIKALFKKEPKVLAASDFSKLSPSEQSNFLKEKAKKDGAEKTWQYIRETFKNQAGKAGDIHDLAHLAGGLIYNQKGFAGLSVCTSDFAFGCYHGFLDKAFETSLDGLNKAEEACASLGQGGPFASCIHGIGHGVASFYQTSNINDSLNACQRLTSGKDYCFDGVFMEYERSAPQDFYSASNPYQPCDSLEKRFGPIYSFACGRNQPTVLMSRFKFSFDDVVKVCLESGSQQFKEACIDTTGFIVARSGSSTEGIISGCRKIGVEEYIARCAKTAAGELIFQDVPGWQKSAPKVCSALSPSYQVECQQYLDNLIQEYDRQK